MSSTQNTTAVNSPNVATTPTPASAPLVVPVPRPFVMPKLVKQGKVATLTNDAEGGGSDIPPIDVP